MKFDTCCKLPRIGLYRGSGDKIIVNVLKIKHHCLIIFQKGV
jgi:hypothetical protein